MNKVILHGNIAKIEDRSSDKTAITQVTIAVNAGWGDNKRTEFIPTVAFGKTAEFLSKWFVKGSEIVCIGEVQQNNYEKQDGTKVYGLRIVLNEVEFAGSKKSEKKSDNEPDGKPDGLDEFDEIEELNLPF